MNHGPWSYPGIDFSWQRSTDHLKGWPWSGRVRTGKCGPKTVRQYLVRGSLSHQNPGSCGYFIFNSHFRISLLVYKLYYFRHRWSGNCFWISIAGNWMISPGSGIRIISTAGIYPVSKKLSLLLVAPIFSQKFMVFRPKMSNDSNDQKCLIDQKMVVYGQGQNTSVLVLSFNIYRFILIPINYFWNYCSPPILSVILSHGQASTDRDG